MQLWNCRLQMVAVLSVKLAVMAETEISSELHPASVSCMPWLAPTFIQGVAGTEKAGQTEVGGKTDHCFYLLKV